MQILFVDDEPAFLASLDDRFHPLEPGWWIGKAQSGRDALALLAKRPFDVIISDLHMPGMDGGDLLQEVMRRHPQVMRFVMSEKLSRDEIRRLAVPSHQCLAKPLDPQSLKQTLRRIAALRGLLSNDTLRRLVTQCGLLPTTPTLYLQLAKELQLESPSFQRAESIIARDPALTSKILQLVNSSYFGLPRKVTSMTDAIMLVGIEIIRSLALCVPVFARFDSSGSKGFSPLEIWEHSWRTSLFARKLAHIENQDPTFCEHAFIAGLLHEIGWLVLAANLPTLCQEAGRLRVEKQLPRWKAEKEVFGCTSGMVGGYLLGLWGLPEALVEAVALHEQPLETPFNIFSPLTVVHVANAIDQASAAGAVKPLADFVDMEYLISLGMHPHLERWHQVCLSLPPEEKKA